MLANDECKCALCGNDRPFDLPTHLVEELLYGNVVLFAGAGISTENKIHAQHTFYESISKEIGCSENLPFPTLMDKYCAQPDGRIKLTKRIKERFDYFISFDEFYQAMTRFHRSIAPLYMIKTIITTNWDDFFERECDFDAFVNESDMALWEASERRLMKIHGSIRNLGSIVATEEDYRKAFQRLNDGPMGAQLKTLLTQKTFVYTGYSLSDDTYIRIAKSIGEMTAPHTRHSYFVAPNIDRNKISNFPIPLIPIETDGAFFFETIRSHLEHEIKLIPEHAFTACEDLLDLAIDIHQETASAFTRAHHPLLIFSLSYQDGLIHGLKRIIKRQMSGEYHCRDHLIHLVQSYEAYSTNFRKKHDYWNSSYSDGYRDAMMYLLIIAENPEAKRPRPPIFGEHGNVSFNSLSSVLRFPKKRIKKCYRVQADRILAKLVDDSQSYLPQHTPYL